MPIAIFCRGLCGCRPRSTPYSRAAFAYQFGPSRCSVAVLCVASRFFTVPCPPTSLPTRRVRLSAEQKKYVERFGSTLQQPLDL